MDSKFMNIILEKIKKILEDRYNQLFLLVLIIAFFIRLYYFNINSTVWWDEAEYLSTAKHWAFDIPYSISMQRPPLFPFLEFIFIKLNISETIMRIFLELIPSTLLIIISYLLVRELYNKKLALITSILMSVFWLGLFNTTRLHVDIPLMLLSYTAVYFFWLAHIKNKGTKYYILSGLFLGLSALMKYTTILLIISLIIFIFIYERLNALKNKNLWLFALSTFLVISVIFVYSYINFNDATIFTRASHMIDDPSQISKVPIAWKILSNIPHFVLTFLFIIFFIGLLSLYELILGLDFIFKERERFQSDIFIILFILITLCFFIFVERDAEDRWLLPIALPLFIIISKGIIMISDFTKNKVFSISIIILLLSIGIYQQLSFADSMIDLKKDSYFPVKQAGLWLKDNSNPNDVIMTSSSPQNVYYSERKSIGIGGSPNLTQLSQFIYNEKGAYLILSIFEPHPQWMYEVIPKESKIFIPVQGYFADQTNKQTVLVIYKINQDALLQYLQSS